MVVEEGLGIGVEGPEVGESFPLLKGKPKVEILSPPSTFDELSLSEIDW